jgi:hypothetical protein
MSVPLDPTGAARAAMEASTTGAALPLTHRSFIETILFLGAPIILLPILRAWLRQGNSEKKDGIIVQEKPKLERANEVKNTEEPERLPKKKKKTHRGKRHSKKHGKGVAKELEGKKKEEKEEKKEVLEYNRGLPRSKTAHQGWRYTEQVEKMNLVVEEPGEEKREEWTRVAPKQKRFSKPRPQMTEEERAEDERQWKEYLDQEAAEFNELLESGELYYCSAGSIHGENEICNHEGEKAISVAEAEELFKSGALYHCRNWNCFKIHKRGDICDYEGVVSPSR